MMIKMDEEDKIIEQNKIKETEAIRKEKNKIQIKIEKKTRRQKKKYH